jgi:hypothetical protein
VDARKSGRSVSPFERCNAGRTPGESQTDSARHLRLVAEGELVAHRPRERTAYPQLSSDGAKDLVPYAKLLKDEIPDQIVNAFRDLGGDWRPTPAPVRAYLNAKRRNAERVDVGRGRDRASTPEAVQATADAYRAGERPCGCHVRRAGWRIDAAGTLRCRTCHGLEYGQVYAAEDAGLIREAA